MDRRCWPDGSVRLRGNANRVEPRTDVLLLAPASQRDSLQHFLRKRKQENGLKIELEVHGDEEVESTASIVNLAAQAGQIKVRCLPVPSSDIP